MPVVVVPTFSKILKLPFHKKLIIVVALFLDNKIRLPKFGFVVKDGKTYFIVGCFSYYVGFRIS